MFFYFSTRGRRYTESSLDDFGFKLCYRLTVLLLIAFSFIVTIRLWFGDSFSCITENDVLPLNYVNVKCYDNGVYFVPWHLDSDKKGKLEYDPSSENDKRYQSYYSWVNLVLLVHAFNFYLPHFLLKSFVGRYVSRITGGLINEGTKGEQEISYLAKQVSETLGFHSKYTFCYIFCEACNFAVSLAQTVWLIYFFQVTGVSVELRTWSEFKNFYFPDEAACQLTKLSASGDIMTFKALCQLPLNSLYMKMFIFLRSWYILLTILCGLVLIHRTISLLSSAIRFTTIRYSVGSISRPDLKSMCQFMRYSDWFFLCRLRMAMTDLDFQRMIKEIFNNLRKRHEFDDETKDIMNEMSPV